MGHKDKKPTQLIGTPPAISTLTLLSKLLVHPHYMYTPYHLYKSIPSI